MNKIHLYKETMHGTYPTRRKMYCGFEIRVAFSDSSNTVFIGEDESRLTCKHCIVIEMKL